MSAVLGYRSDSEGASLWGSRATITRLWAGCYARGIEAADVFLAPWAEMGKKADVFRPRGMVYSCWGRVKALRAHPAFRAAVNRDCPGSVSALWLCHGASFYLSRSLQILPGSYAVVTLGQPPVIHPILEARRVVSLGGRTASHVGSRSD